MMRDIYSFFLLTVSPVFLLFPWACLFLVSPQPDPCIYVKSVARFLLRGHVPLTNSGFLHEGVDTCVSMGLSERRVAIRREDALGAIRELSAGVHRYRTDQTKLA